MLQRNFIEKIRKNMTTLDKKFSIFKFKFVKFKFKFVQVKNLVKFFQLTLWTNKKKQYNNRSKKYNYLNYRKSIFLKNLHIINLQLINKILLFKQYKIIDKGLYMYKYYYNIYD